jgi:hypothetical protein
MVVSLPFPSAKYFCLRKSEYMLFIPPSRLDAEGRIAIVTTREAGMRWTLWRRARVSPADERRWGGREGAWSWCPDAGTKSSGDEPRDDGSKKARFPGRARYKR